MDSIQRRKLVEIRRKTGYCWILMQSPWAAGLSHLIWQLSGLEASRTLFKVGFISDRAQDIVNSVQKSREIGTFRDGQRICSRCADPSQVIASEFLKRQPFVINIQRAQLPKTGNGKNSAQNPAQFNLDAIALPWAGTRAAGQGRVK